MIINTDKLIYVEVTLQNQYGSFINDAGFAIVAITGAQDQPNGSWQNDIDLSQDSALLAAIVGALPGVNVTDGTIASASPYKPSATKVGPATTDATPA